MVSGAVRRTRASKPTRGAGRLTARDIEMLTFIGRARAVTTDAVATLFFGDRSTASRRLARLAGAGLLRVHVSHLNDPNWYVLTDRGATALAADGIDPDTLFPGRLPKRDALDHLRHLTDFRVAVLLACRARPEVTLKVFLADHDLRRLAGTSTPPLVPDAIVEFERPACAPLMLLVEIDLAQESAAFFATTKGVYTRDAAKTRTPHWGMARWRPIELAPTETRLRSLARALANVGADTLWLGTTFGTLQAVGVFGAAFATMAAVSATLKEESLRFPLRLVPANRSTS